MTRKISVRHGSASNNLTHQMFSLLKAGHLSTVTGAESFDASKQRFDAITGAEAGSFDINQKTVDKFSGMGAAQRNALVDSIRTMGDATRELPNFSEQMIAAAGMEGFSQAQFQGSGTKIRGASIVLNALAHRQTPAAEALYPTVTIPYQDEQLEFTVRTAGLGRYVFGASAYEVASDLRPVMSLIREGKYFMDDTLVLVPVYPTDDTDADRKFFVDAADLKPVDYSYSPADALGRKTHETSYLKVPVRVNNLLGLCQAPGAIPFDSTDEIESNSLRIKHVLLKGSIAGTATKFVLDTQNMSQMTFGLSSQGHSSDDRQLNARIQGLPSTALKNVDGTAADFSKINANGAQAFFALSVTGTFQRQNNTLEIQGGAFDIDYIIDANGVKHYQTTDNATIKALFGQFTAASVAGVDIHANHTNTNRNNFGYRVEVYDAHKVLGIRRQTPISVKYPVAKEDTNEDSLNFAIEQMATTLNAMTTTAAFVAAAEHFDYISSISGSAIVGNQQGSNVLAGQHFVNATAMHRKLKLADIVSTENSVDVFDNISAALINNLTEMAAGLATNSGLAAISEYTRETLEWTVVAHQNLGRYLMRSGDARTLGGYQNFEVELSNIDTMVGKFYLVPKSKTTADEIDPVGGIGICVSKEYVVVTGQVTRNNKDFGTVITQPAFKHNATSPIIGLLEITDAATALTDEGLVKSVNAQRVFLTNASEVSTGTGSTTTSTDTDTDAGKLP